MPISVSTGRRPAEPKKSRRRSRLRHLATLAELPAKIPEKIEEGIEKGIEGIGKGVTATVDILKDPIGSVQQVVDALQAPRGLALGWAIALILPIFIYFLDLGAGSLAQGADAEFALALRSLADGQVGLDAAAQTLPPPRGSPLGLWQMMLMVRLLGANEATLRLLPVLAALGSAMCLLAISIDVGVGRHAGGLAGLVLLALPRTYELSHRVVPDMLVAIASVGAVALVSHSLHGHKFDRHILPMHRDNDAPEPLPLRRLPMLFATLGIGLSALVDPRAGVIAIGFALLDILISHRYLLRKRRVWLMLGGAVLLTVLATMRHPTDLRMWLRWPSPGLPLRTFKAIWHQGDSWFSRYIGPVVIVATAAIAVRVVTETVVLVVSVPKVAKAAIRTSCRRSSRTIDRPLEAQIEKGSLRRPLFLTFERSCFAGFARRGGGLGEEGHFPRRANALAVMRAARCH